MNTESEHYLDGELLNPLLEVLLDDRVADIPRDGVAAKGSETGAEQDNDDASPEFKQGTSKNRQHDRSRDSKCLDPMNMTDLLCIRHLSLKRAEKNWILATRGKKQQASKRDLRDVESHEDKEDLVVMLLEVILKKDAPVLDILCRSGELEPLAPLPMNKWGILEYRHQVRHESTAIGGHTIRKSGGQIP